MDINKENFLNRKTKRPQSKKNTPKLNEKNQEKYSSIESLYTKAKTIYEQRVKYFLIIVIKI